MNSIRCFKIAALLALASLSAAAQDGIVTLTSPSPKILVSGQMQLTAFLTDLAGTPLDGSGLAWSSSDNTLATVSPTGMLQGIFPGDISITAADSISGASASLAIHVVPGSIAIQIGSSSLHVGDSAQLSASALDAAGKVIPGVQFQFRSGDSAVASIAAGGALTGIAEGFTTVEARIPSVTNDEALVSTMRIQVLPALAYKVRKLFSTDVTASTTISAFATVSAVSASEIGSIVTLANGNQAAILIEAGKPKVLAVVGQALPNTGRMVMRIDGISANSKGDVALLIEYPSQFCNASVFFFPHGQPEQEIAPANCNNGMYSRSLAEDGSILYRYNDQIYTASLSSAPKLLFSIATQPAAKDPVRGVGDFAPSRAGTFVLNTTLTSGIHAYLYFDGKSLSQVYKDGDTVEGQISNGLDNLIGSSDGSFYARINIPNLEVLAKIEPGPLQPVVTNGDGVPGGTVGWIQGVYDAGPGGILVDSDFAVGSYHNSLAVWNGKAFVEYVPTAGWGSMISGALLPDGTAVVSQNLQELAVPGLRTVSSKGAVAMIMAAGTPFPQPVPAGIDWHFASRGGSATTLVLRGAGEAVVNASNSPQPLVTLGSALPNQQTASWIGAAIGNESGDVAFTAGYSTGSAVFRYRAGKFDTVIDSGIGQTGPAGASLAYVQNGRGRYLAMNNRGDVVATGGYNTTSGSYFGIVLFASDGPHLVAQQGGAVPGGVSYSNFPNLALDDGGHVMFISNTSDGKSAAFYWDGKAVHRVVGVGDTGSANLTVNEVSNIAGSGSGFLIVLAFGNYAVRELRYYDGVQMRTLESTATTLLDATGLSYFWANESTLAANGDAHSMAATQDAGLGVYAHRADGRDLIVARSRDQLPGGEWLLMPLSLSSSMNGEVYFTADVWLNGVEALALYEATPQ